MSKNLARELHRPPTPARRREGANALAEHRQPPALRLVRRPSAALEPLRVVPIYWDPELRVSAERVAVLDELLRALFESSWLAELGLQRTARACLMPSFVCTETPPAALNQSQVERRLCHWLTSGAITPAPALTDHSLIYLLFTPPATRLRLGTLRSPKDFYGYHDCTHFDGAESPRSSRFPTQNLFYAALPLAPAVEILRDRALPICREIAQTLRDRAEWLRRGSATHAG
jgi:hypothetical protein